MKRVMSLVAVVVVSFAFQRAANPDLAKWQARAKNVTIIRDDWGIAHVFGKSDADAVFGMIYAQAEDDFNRVETNYINSLGRLAEAEGQSAIYQDLRMKLFIDPVVLKKDYAASPAWLQTLMNAWADGLNFYLVRTRSEAARHHALRAVDGAELHRRQHRRRHREGEPGAPAGVLRQAGQSAAGSRRRRRRSSRAVGLERHGGRGGEYAAHHALLLINPHTSFFFRSELEMVSDEGLNAYGAATWGQFFLYQGFNDRVGWMHTSSGVDAVDEYLETVTKQGDHYVYKYGTEERPVIASRRSPCPTRRYQGMAKKTFTVYRTHHGPVVREPNGKWVAIALMNKPDRGADAVLHAHEGARLRVVLKTMDLQANSSNNTIFADADGDIAYFHGNFIPRRDPSFDWKQPVDGSNPATDWKGLLSVDETPHLLNPASGWIYNSNDSPWEGPGRAV